MHLALLSIALTTALIWINFLALGLLARQWAGSYLLARVSAPATVALVLFFVEHFVGLGDIAWLWPLLTVGAAYIVRRDLSVVRGNWRAECLLVVCFAYCFAWRFAFPDISPSSEKIADVSLIASYAAGVKLPPVDYWLPPFRLDVYYGFQHYAAALLGRVFGLDLGHSYHYAVSLLCGWTFAAAIGAARLIGGSRRAAVLPALAIVIGGTGVTPFLPAIVEQVRPYDSMRFIGGTAVAERAMKPLGRWLAGFGPEGEAQELPTETLSYLVHLGDYHPPLSGFYLLAVALLAIALLDQPGWAARAGPHLVLGGASIAPLFANPWSFPLQLLLLAGWMLYCFCSRRRWLPMELIGGGVLVALLGYPFLAAFGERSMEYGASIRLVPVDEHSPLVFAVLLFFPVLAILIPNLFTTRFTSLVFCLGATFSVALVFSELFFVDDVYSGKFNRFNSTLKWWPWIQTGVFATLGAANLGSKNRWRRLSTGLVLLAVCTYGVDLGRNFIDSPKASMARLSGTAWIEADDVEKALLAYLQAQPQGIVLQRLDAGAFTAEPALAILGGHQVLIGWPAHEKLWRAGNTEVELRRTSVEAFYRGGLADSLGWLKHYDVDHILWLKGDNSHAPEAFAKLSEQLESAYYWHEFYSVGDFRVGLWSRWR